MGGSFFNVKKEINKWGGRKLNIIEFVENTGGGPAMPMSKDIIIEDLINRKHDQRCYDTDVGHQNT